MRNTRFALMVLALAFALTSVAAAAAKKPAPAKRARTDANIQWWGPAPGPRPWVTGTVAEVGPAAIAVRNRQGVKRFIVTPQTQIRVRGVRAVLADVKVADPVIVKFRLQANNYPLALGIAVPKTQLKGVITAIDGRVVTYKDGDAVRKFAVSEDTRFTSHGYNGTFADLRVGYRVSVVTQAPADVPSALWVAFLPSWAKGAVTAVDGDVITVKTVQQMELKLQGSAATAVPVRPRVGPNVKGIWLTSRWGSP